ncbi:transmembrane protein, putative [Rhizoctonia solani AG-3 Rhs1AP]|uniref:Transmembrane protein, putative n=1 Tax=Rhizoctonia solani AG-3 Rhs1AP TaxID=1086054 RepID=A0A0A1UKN2_9AGAM|nr:transmembrane protein, putative [Rhizoctonia solani AG-3 Rhs1AP]
MSRGYTQVRDGEGPGGEEGAENAECPTDNPVETQNTQPKDSQVPTPPATSNLGPPEQFDEYGAELEPEARVWKTYVKVADKFDMEQVEGWNRSLDVTLIFAGIFTAICTAFVIESAKSLKETPDEASAHQLAQIKSILLVIANISDPQSPNSTNLIASASSKPFSPRGVDVCVNALWFFALILSATVALLAMLAKEWCHLFISGRIGDPWSQTTKRQRRWKGIKKWKMEELILFLPSFIHLSVWSFAIGLCIYLGDLNRRVAVLVVIVTIRSMIVYVLSTLLPLFRSLKQGSTICPYSTSISRLIPRFRWRHGSDRQRPDQSKQGSHRIQQESPSTDRVAVEALAWLIETGEDPTATDTALQAIAGADPSEENRKLLQAYGADRMVSWRLIGLDSYSKNYNQISDLYTRALSFFSPSSSAPNPGSGLQKSPPHGLQKSIRDARDKINNQIIAYTSTNRQFLPTYNSIQALSIGSTAASHCLRSLGNGVQAQTRQQYKSAIDLLERYRDREVHLNLQEVQFLMAGIAMLLSSLVVGCAPAAGAQYVMELIRKADTAKNNQEQLRLKYLSLPMVVYALSRHDYPVWPDTSSYHLRSRAQRAIDVVAYYVSQPTPSKLNEVSSTMINLGLLELLADPDIYKLNDGDIKTISEAFDSSAREAPIYTLPSISNTDIYTRSLKGIIKLISKEQHTLLDDDTKDVAIACLTILNRIPVVQWTANPLFEQVYAFVIECVLKIPPSGSESYGQNAALDLMQKFHDHVQSRLTENFTLGLAKSLDKRNVFMKLKEATEKQATSDDANFTANLFATGQASLFINLAIKSGVADHEDWRRCLGSLVGNESLSEFGALARRGESFAEQYRDAWSNDLTTLRHTYFKVLSNSLPSAGIDQSSLVLGDSFSHLVLSTPSRASLRSH